VDEKVCLFSLDNSPVGSLLAWFPMRCQERYCTKHLLRFRRPGEQAAAVLMRLRPRNSVVPSCRPNQRSECALQLYAGSGEGQNLANSGKHSRLLRSKTDRQSKQGAAGFSRAHHLFAFLARTGCLAPDRMVNTCSIPCGSS